MYTVSGFRLWNEFCDVVKWHLGVLGVPMCSLFNMQDLPWKAQLHFETWSKIQNPSTHNRGHSSTSLLVVSMPRQCQRRSLGTPKKLIDI